MAKIKQVLMLEIEFDPAEENTEEAPSTWDWNSLCDMANPEAIKVIGHTEATWKV